MPTVCLPSETPIKILVIDAGHLREFGSHEELMAQQGLYAKFYEYQQAMEGVEAV